jgi:L-asparaginase/Glu-tRNA(Gln) amidotransferase subunit D
VPPTVVVVSTGGTIAMRPELGTRGGSSPSTGAVFAGDLAGPKARVLLQLAGGDATAVAAEA